ncbi:hypothetical protein CHLNCDRAFT_135778 [Chlorella variabilis]|uniref:Uncharacterized protein n=1 Tax=Chlorella variabilis TaxID=554065 RepID=E1ZIZ6_CHLVA|nr:hypothetical protein CHLNCDRAFT_135778 [Chlorella variabilis]EFN54418.1 hypothetical protein CHLNCDRAFT_135778 [Chlorella variabilis]|eukprot:XP_005846520.1 hypothetical protein CHLNCDRAFT_135778 [Chlorella variabilis]
MQRRLAHAAGRLLVEGQGVALCQGFPAVHWQLAPPPAAGAAALHLPPGGLRWHSELAQRKPEGQQDFVYEAPFGAALTWFTQPYVTRLRYERGTGSVEASTLTLLGRPRTDRFQLGEVQEAASMHPLTSFQARGRRYYVDAEHFGDKALLARLQPAAAAAHVTEAAEAAQAAQHRPQQQGREQQH